MLCFFWYVNTQPEERGRKKSEKIWQLMKRKNRLTHEQNPGWQQNGMVDSALRQVFNQKDVAQI